MKKYILLLLLIGLLLPITSCSNRENIVSSNDRTFVMKAFERNQTDIQNSQVVRTLSTNEGLIRYAQLLIQKGSETSEELMNLANERDIPIAVELSQSNQGQVTTLINAPKGEFDAMYLTTIIQSRKIAIDMYQQQIRNGSDNALREWASGKISQLIKDQENAEILLEQVTPYKL